MARMWNASKVTRGIAALLCCLASPCLLSTGSRRVSLEELDTRVSGTFEPRLLGRNVLVRGVIVAPVFHFVDYNLLVIEDGAGGILRSATGDKWLEKFRPGEEIEAEGKVSVQYGMPVLLPDTITIVGRKPVSPALDLSTRTVQDLKYL